MSNQNVLIISDSWNQNYWNILSHEIEDRVGVVRIALDSETPKPWSNSLWDTIVMDISDLDQLHNLIPEIHHEQPDGKIIIVSSTPTWKLTRDVIRLGATSLMRKTYHLDEVLLKLSSSPHSSDHSNHSVP